MYIDVTSPVSETWSGTCTVHRPADKGGPYQKTISGRVTTLSSSRATSSGKRGVVVIAGNTIPWAYPRPYSRCIAQRTPLGGSFELVVDGYPATLYGRIPSETMVTPGGASVTIKRIPNITDFSGLPTISTNERSRNYASFADSFNDGSELANAALEFGDNIALLANLATSVMHFYRGIRHGSVSDLNRAFGGGKIRSVSKNISSRYLEYIYGIQPTLDDIHSTFEVLKNTPLSNLIARRKRMFTLDREFSDGGFRFSGKLHHQVGCHYWFDSPELHNMSSLGLINPALIAWNAVPYSFVLDWILPIGSLLNSLTAYAGANFISGWDTLYLEGTCTCAPRYSSLSASWPTASSLITIKSMRRQALTGFPRPLPFVKNPLSTIHLVNFAAMWRQRYK